MHCSYRARLRALTFIAIAVLASALLAVTGCGGGGAGPLSSAAQASAISAAPTPSGVPSSSHVVLVIEENHKFSEVYPQGMPWLVAQGDKYAYASNYHANVPGSLLDYLWLSSGSGEEQFGCTGDHCGSMPPSNGQPITDDNIFRALDKAGKSWKVYAQGLPAGDPTKIYQSGAYVARHNPAVFYSDILNDVNNAKSKIVPFTQFATDLANDALPNYSLIIPDLNHDAHDGTLAQADAFLANNVAPVLNTPAFQPGGDGLLFVTFDECDAAVGACPEVVYTAAIGPNAKRGVVSTTFYRHESMLRTILDALGVSEYPGASNSAPDMLDFF